MSESNSEQRHGEGYYGIISSRPDLALEIGLFTSAYSVMEFVPVLILSRVVDTDLECRPISHEIMKSIGDNMHIKLNLVEKCISVSSLEEDLKRSLISIIQTAQKVRVFRNALSHSGWICQGGRVFQIDKKGKESEITVETIKEMRVKALRLPGQCASALGIKIYPSG